MKFKSILAVALIALMAACTSPESLTKDYVEAAAKQDKEAAAEIQKEIDELGEDAFTAEQKAALQAAYISLHPEEHMQAVESAAKNAYENAYEYADEYADEYAY